MWQHKGCMKVKILQNNRIKSVNLYYHISKVSIMPEVIKTAWTGTRIDIQVNGVEERIPK